MRNKNINQEPRSFLGKFQLASRIRGIIGANFDRQNYPQKKSGLHWTILKLLYIFYTMSIQYMFYRLVYGKI